MSENWGKITLLYTGVMYFKYSTLRLTTVVITGKVSKWRQLNMELKRTEQKSSDARDKLKKVFSPSWRVGEKG